MLSFIFVFTLTVFPAYANAENLTKEEVYFDEKIFDKLDLYLTIAIHEKSEGKKLSSVSPETIIPLYDLYDNIFAYYVEMSDNTYMIVNANRDNPVLLEFGEGTYENLKDLAESKDYTGNIVYFGAGSYVRAETAAEKNNGVYTDGKNKAKITKEAKTEINKFYDLCETENSAKKNMLSKTKEILLESKTIVDDFYDSIIIFQFQLPSLAYLSDDIRFYRSFVYGTTGDFEILTALDGGTITNHCAATSAYNMVAYYRYCMGDTISSSERDSVFLHIHSYMGNGPVLPAAYHNRIEAYIENETDYSIALSDPAETWAAYINEVQNDRMCFLCIINALLITGHFINGTGYRIYEDGSQYARVIDNWKNNSYRFYIFGEYLNQIGGVYIYD